MKTHRAKEKVQVEESSGNVFKDLEHPNPDEALVKAKLSLHIAKIVEKNGWNQKKAAERMGIDQPKVSKILRGQLREFSVERLIDFLRAIGCDVDIVLRNGTASPAALRVVEEQEEHSRYNPCVPYKEFGPGRRGSRRRGRSSVRARLDGHAGRD